MRHKIAMHNVRSKADEQRVVADHRIMGTKKEINQVKTKTKESSGTFTLEF